MAHRGGTKLSVRSARHGEAADEAGERLRRRDDHVDGPLLRRRSTPRTRIHSIFRLPIGGKDAAAPRIALETDRWLDLELRWDSTKRTCEALIDGKVVATLPQLHESDGPSYLRIKCDAVVPEKARLLIDSVDVNVRPDK